MGLVEEGLLKERNWNHYCSSTRPGPLYMEYEKCVCGEKFSIHLSCMWCFWWISCTYCVKRLKTSTEGVQTSETWQRCQNNTLKAMWKMEICGFSNLLETTLGLQKEIRSICRVLRFIFSRIHAKYRTLLYKPLPANHCIQSKYEKDDNQTSFVPCFWKNSRKLPLLEV